MENNVDIKKISQMKNDNRIQWIDTAKLIGIFFMILGHLEWTFIMKGTSTVVIKWIYCFHMPLFFFLSGVTTKKCSIMETMRKCFYQLLLPYVFLCLIMWVWHIIILWGNTSDYVEDFLIKPLIGIFIGLGYDTNVSVSIPRALWFLLALCWCRVIYAILSKYKKSFILNVIFSLCFFLVSFILFKTNRFIPLSIGSAFMVYPIFFVACNFSDFIKKICKKLSEHIFISVMVGTGCYIFVYLLGVKVNGSVSVSQILFGNYFILFYINSLVGILGTLAISVAIRKLGKVFSFLSKNTLLIMPFHVIIIQLLIKSIEIFSGKFLGFSMVQGVFFSFVVLLLCVFPIYFVRRFFPWIVSFPTKNNTNGMKKGDCNE